MARTMTPRRRRINVTLSAIVFGLITLPFTRACRDIGLELGLRHPKQELPLPYTFSKSPDHTPLRLAMVHDILCERYTIHSKAYYQARKAKAEATIAKFQGSSKPPSDKLLDAYDILGVCLDKLQDPSKAVEVLRQKLGLMKKHFQKTIDSRPAIKGLDYELLSQNIKDEVALTAEQLALYRTHANLGTFLIHSSLKQAFAGDKAARKQLVEGHKHIVRAVEINPGAHFGRETWQIVAVEHLILLLDRPEFLMKFDLFGNSWTDSPERPNSILGERRHHVQHLLRDLEDSPKTHTDERSYKLYQARQSLTRLGADPEWVEAITKGLGEAFLKEPASFDEPVLGILGMWTLGGGANPHFSVSLAIMMDSVGQDYIAWEAYERTKRLAHRFSKDETIQQALIDYCKSQQARLKKTMPRSSIEAQFAIELERGFAYQESYMAYEEKKIRAGVEPNSFGFYEAFYKQHGSPSSPAGDADYSLFEYWEGPLQWINHLPAILLFAGLGAFIGLKLD